MRTTKAFTCIFMFVLLACMAYGQGVGASGDIKGVVTDTSGAVVTNATVTVTDAEKALQRTGTTDKSGEYRITGLAPTSYEVSAAASGFATNVEKGVVINVGQVITLDFHLKVSAAAERIEVTTEPPIVETARGHQADTVNEQYIRNLPIDRRDYLTYTLLMPGVNDSRTLANSHDFRVAQTPQSGLSFYGSNGRGNNVTVDGGEYANDSGGVRPTISQDAVQEFQINRSNYAAEFGSASGATINIVSKTGTNNMHGSAFGYFRDDAFDAQDPFSFKQALALGQTFNPALPDSVATPVKNSLSRQQFGASVGFPVVKDKTFLFFSGEGLRQRQQVAVPLLTNTNIFRPQADSFNNQQAIINALAAQGNGVSVPCLTGQTALPSAICAGILTNIFTINPATSPRSKYAIDQLEFNGGIFPFSENEALASGRLDHQFSSTDTLHVRYSFGRDNSGNSNLQALTGVSHGFSTKLLDHTAQAGWFHEFTPSVLNELRVQWNFSKLDVIPNSRGQVGIDIPGYASLGSDIFLPNFTMMHRYEFTDNLTFTRGHHTMKAGFYELVRRNRTDSETFFPGRFVFGSLPGGVVTPCFQVPAACGLTGVNPAVINSLQNVSLGLPLFYQQGFGNRSLAATLPLTAFYWQDSWVVKPNFTLTFGARYELDERQAVTTDNDNVAPRISFAWDPFKSGKTVVRGGYGFFYSPVYYQIDDVVRTLGNINNTRQIANYFVPITGQPGNPALTSAAIFQTLFAQGKVQCHNPAAGQFACITPADLTQFGINVTNSGPVPPLSVLFDSSPNYQNPYSQQASFGIERELGWGFSVAANYIYAHTIRLPRAIDTNLLPAPGTIVTLKNGQSIGVRNWNSNLPNALGAAPCAGAAIVTCFANPLILQNNTYTSSASALYHGGIFELKRRFSNHFSLLMNYTYSRATDDSTDYNSDYEPNDQINFRGERSLSEFDQRHKIVITGLVESPFKGEGLTSAILGGFTLSPIFRGNTSHPFNLLAGTDVNGDRHSNTDRPIAVPRNTGIGPDFYTFDMGLSRRVHFGHEWSVQFNAQAFNLFNRTNFATVNNVVGSTFGPVGGQSITPSGIRNVFPNVPLAFTSVNPFTGAKREFQFGIRLDF